MVHPLGRAGLLHRLLSIGLYEQSGTIDTVGAMGVGHGPAMRSVAHDSNCDQSRMEIPRRESGQYGSPYYRDPFVEWLAGRGIFKWALGSSTGAPHLFSLSVSQICIAWIRPPLPSRKQTPLCRSISLPATPAFVSNGLRNAAIARQVGQPESESQPPQVRDCCNKIIAIESGWLLQWCEICSAHRVRRTRQNESVE